MKDAYITDRWLPGMIKEICKEKGIAVQAFSDDWILRLKNATHEQFIFGFKFGGLNDSAAVAVSQDKVATYELLKDADLPAVPHVLVSTRADVNEKWIAQAEGWGDFILKPTHGAGGRAVYFVRHIKEAKAVMDQHAEPAWCIAPFLNITTETRIIMLDSTVLLAFEKRRPVIVHGVPMHNLRLGAVAVNVVPSGETIALADNARQALGLRFAAIDIIETGGQKMILEVNEGFSLEHYMRQSEENEGRGDRLYRRVIEVMMRG